ncbi:MAG TPA: hypothetical protein DCG54_07660 [Anaerolineae bacterium]|jgi:DNA invertase Pin-like site-specific DNA recombinase|nr:hypothetical protein [Anaerolineae bacterium]
MSSALDPIIPPPPALTPGSTVWAYLRDSGGSGQDRSVEQQRQIVHEVCARYGLILEHLFEDAAISGKSTSGRSQFDQMLSLSTQADKRPQGLLIWNFARFARNTDDSQIYKGILRKRGIIIHSLTNQIPEGPFAAVIETLIHVADEQKRAEAAAGAWRGLHSVVAQGAVPGTPPRGFMREPMTVVSERGVSRIAHRWAPDPEMTPRIRKAFAMRAEGRSLKEIKAETRLYKDLNSYTTFFANRLYIGILDYGGKEFVNYCEPVIDMETWHTVQEIARQSAARQHVKSDGPNHPRRKNSSFLLTGLAFCARCGAPLYGHTSGRPLYAPARAYRCTQAKRNQSCDLPRIPDHALEKLVIDGLKEIESNPHYIEEMHAQALDKSQNAAGEITAKRRQINADLKSARAKLTNVTNAIEAGGHTPALLARNAELETDIASIQTSLRAIAETSAESAPPESVEEIRERMRLACLAIEHAATPEETQTILRGILARVVVERHENELFLGLDIWIPKKKAHPPPENDEINCVPSLSIPVGAQVYRHTIAAVITKKPRSK